MSVELEHRRVDAPEVRPFRSEPTGQGEARSRTTPHRRTAIRKRILLGVLLAAGGVLLAAAITTVTGGLGKPDPPLVYYTVIQSDVPITVTERGNLESRNNVEVICEVDDIPGDSIRGTTILWLVS